MEETTQGEKEPPFVSVLVLNWNGRSLLETCLPPLLNQDYPNYEVVVIDNASTDDSLAFVEASFPQVRLIRHSENYGFSRGYNLVLQQMQADIVVLVNSDVIVKSNCLTALVQPLVQDNQIGVAGGVLQFPDGTVQFAGAQLTYPLAKSKHYYYQEPDTNQVGVMRDVDYVTGAVMAIPQRVLAEVGVFDEAFSPFYYEEVDYCYRVRDAGYRVVVVPERLGIHDESTSMRLVHGQRAYWYQKNRMRFVVKHYSLSQLLHDFVPAELAQLQGADHAPALQLLRHVYLETAVSLTNWLPEADTAQVAVLQSAFLQLRQVAAASPMSGQLMNSWQESPLAQKANLVEFDFTSEMPLFGEVIAGFRRLWNSVSTKWYVRQLMQQQMQFNKLTAHLMDELQKQNHNDKVEIHLLVSELLQLQQQQQTFAAETTAKLDKLQQQFAAIESLLKQNREGERSR